MYLMYSPSSTASVHDIVSTLEIYVTISASSLGKRIYKKVLNYRLSMIILSIQHNLASVQVCHSNEIF